MLLLRTHMWIASRPLSLSPFSSMVSGIGVTNDLDEPDRATVEMRVAVRHSGIPGVAPEEELHKICHLSRVMADVRKLKKPSWA